MHTGAMLFADRAEAGKLLAEKLTHYMYPDAVVLALPRGGVILGAEIARALGFPLDIIAVRKIGHPSAPEYAIGAVDEHGTVILNEQEAASMDPEWLKEEIAREREEAERRALVYRDDRKPIYIPGKSVILVDDGIATGLTMRLAAHTIKKQHPEKIVVAVAVAPSETIDELNEAGMEVITLLPPAEFLGAVGAHYISFPQVTDEEVIRALQSLDRAAASSQK